MKNLILCSILLISTTLQAQNPSENLKKYWHYWERFHQKFIRIGEGAGESIPAAGLAPHWDCKSNWHIKNQRCYTYKKGKGVLFWGDSTIELGNYISTLSMMIRNLKDTGADYSQVAKELYLAIKAFERLDATAETYFGETPKLNGFFIRDDVPHDFYLKKNDALKFKHRNNEEYNCLISHGSCKLDDVMDGSIASQDQIMNLVLGFSFVCQMIPEVTWKNQNLSELAQLQIHRIVSHLSSNAWKITAPDGSSPPNKWGGNTIAYSNFLALTAERFVGRKYQKKSYKNFGSRFWGGMIRGTFNWGHALQTERNLWMAYAGVICAGKWNAKQMTKKALKQGREMYALAYCAINGKKLDRRIKRQQLEQILNSAPWNGPCFGTPDCKAPKGWQGRGRWIHIKRKNGNPYGIEQTFNGLDYMLFYNLYYYFYKDELPPFGVFRQ